MKKLLSESILSSFEINFSFVTSSFPDFVQNQILIPGGKSTFLKYTQISGVENEQQNTFDFEIFPNPAKDKFKVQSLPAGQAGLKFKVENAKIELYDLNGNKLLEKQIPKGTENFELDICSLKSGVYFCKISTQDHSSTKKIIIQK